MTQLKVLVGDPANDWDFPLKVLGIAVVFAGLMYMLFAHSDVVRENIVLGVNKLRRLFGKDDIAYAREDDDGVRRGGGLDDDDGGAASTSATTASGGSRSSPTSSPRPWP